MTSGFPAVTIKSCIPRFKKVPPFKSLLGFKFTWIHRINMLQKWLTHSIALRVDKWWHPAFLPLRWTVEVSMRIFWFERLLGFKLTSIPRIIMLQKRLGHSVVPGSNWFFLSCFLFTTIKSRQKSFLAKSSQRKKLNKKNT